MASQRRAAVLDETTCAACRARDGADAPADLAACCDHVRNGTGVCRCTAVDPPEIETLALNAFRARLRPEMITHRGFCQDFATAPIARDSYGLQVMPSDYVDSPAFFGTKPRVCALNARLYSLFVKRLGTGSIPVAHPTSGSVGTPRGR